MSKDPEIIEEEAPRVHKTLAEALLAAQRDISAVAKNARHGKANSEYSYRYTSADEMVDACRKALHMNGLVARRKSWAHNLTDRSVNVEYYDRQEVLASKEEIPVYEVVSRLILTLAHTGETEEIELPWVAIPGKGRPIDKSIAGALTTCNSYWLLGLLQVPRVDEDEMNRRDDGPTREDPRAAARRDAERSRGEAKGPASDGKAAPSSRPVVEKPKGSLADAKRALVDAVTEWMEQQLKERPPAAKVYALCTKVLIGLKVIEHAKQVSEDIAGFNAAATWVKARIQANDPLSVLEPRQEGPRTEPAEPEP